MINHNDIQIYNSFQKLQDINQAVVISEQRFIDTFYKKQIVAYIQDTLLWFISYSHTNRLRDLLSTELNYLHDYDIAIFDLYVNDKYKFTNNSWKSQNIWSRLIYELWNKFPWDSTYLSSTHEAMQFYTKLGFVYMWDFGFYSPNISQISQNLKHKYWFW